MWTKPRTLSTRIPCGDLDVTLRWYGYAPGFPETQVVELGRSQVAAGEGDETIELEIGPEPVDQPHPDYVREALRQVRRWRSAVEGARSSGTEQELRMLESVGDMIRRRLQSLRDDYGVPLPAEADGMIDGQFWGLDTGVAPMPQKQAP